MPIGATINTASSNTNLKLIAHPCDVAPDGTEDRIAMGAILGSQSRIDEGKSWRDANGTITWP